MTKSQRRTTIAAVLGGLSAAFAGVTPYVGLLPEKYRPAGSGAAALGALIGLGLAAFNQSLNTNHVSIPAKKAKALGIAAKQTKGK